LPCEVDAVLNSEAALEKLANNDYDVIVTDIKMPRLNGEQLYEQIVELDPRLAQRIILMTGDVISASTRNFSKKQRIGTSQSLSNSRNYISWLKNPKILSRKSAI
jgi:CheY-like chemotaxis protein